MFIHSLNPFAHTAFNVILQFFSVTLVVSWIILKFCKPVNAFLKIINSSPWIACKSLYLLKSLVHLSKVVFMSMNISVPLNSPCVFAHKQDIQNAYWCCRYEIVLVQYFPDIQMKLHEMHLWATSENWLIIGWFNALHSPSLVKCKIYSQEMLAVIKTLKCSMSLEPITAYIFRLAIFQFITQSL